METESYEQPPERSATRSYLLTKDPLMRPYSVARFFLSRMSEAEQDRRLSQASKEMRAALRVCGEKGRKNPIETKRKKGMYLTFVLLKWLWSSPGHKSD